MVPTTWLTWPTLHHGGGQVKTAGVLFHQGPLQELARALGELVMAELRIEIEGQYAGAVRVLVADTVLGSISHEQAAAFRAIVEELGEDGLPATCRAQFEVEPYLNVWLDARPERRHEDDPFLPPFSSFEVALDSEQTVRLDEGLHSKAKNKRVVTVGRLVPTPGPWQLVLDDTPVGLIPERLLAVEAAMAAGMPLTCQVRILREEGKGLRVMADLPPSGR
jgi:hypothetical protein